jgi:hypothetical protein
MCTLHKSVGTILVVLCLFLFSRPAQAEYGGGTGEPNDPYLIYTAEHLNAIGARPNDWDKHFRLMANVDLSGVTYSGAVIPRFAGTFDGNGHTISNFAYDSNGVDDVGLFGYVGWEGAQIKNLGLIDPNIDAGTGDYVGSLAGRMDSGCIVADCYVEGGAVRGRDWVGGLVGRHGLTSAGRTITNSHSTASVTGHLYVGGLVGQNQATVSNCSSGGRVSGDVNVGGLVGKNYFGTITSSYADGSVSGNWSVGGLVGHNGGTITGCHSGARVQAAAQSGRIGGLVGGNWGRGTIIDCYSTGAVSGNEHVGGLVGVSYQTVIHCYSVGPVTGTADVGGLIGSRSPYGPGVVEASFWDIETSGQTASDGGTGKTTAEMKTAATFLDAGWDFVNVWGMAEFQTYPYLRKYSAADINQDDSVNFLDLCIIAEQWMEEK